MGTDMGNWFFPNGTTINTPGKGTDWDIYRTRGEMAVLMQRKRGGIDGIFRCDIPDEMNVTQTIYTGVYSANTGKYYMYISAAVYFIIGDCSVDMKVV